MVLKIPGLSQYSTLLHIEKCRAFISILKGYRPSSALQAMFSVYRGVFSVCLQNLIWTCSIVLLSKYSTIVHIEKCRTK